MIMSNEETKKSKRARIIGTVLDKDNWIFAGIIITSILFWVLITRPGPILIKTLTTEQVVLTTYRIHDTLLGDPSWFYLTNSTMNPDIEVKSVYFHPVGTKITLHWKITEYPYSLRKTMWYNGRENTTLSLVSWELSD